MQHKDRHRDATVRGRLAANFGWLAGSTGVSAIASLVYVGLTARTLGPREFGIFALLLTYGELLTNFAQFQSWKTVTSFGAAHQERGNRPRLARLVGYTASLDCLSGIAGAIAGLVGIFLLGPILHWSISEQREAAWFGTILLLTSSTTPVGLLRLLDRFDLQVVGEFAAQLTRLLGCIAGWAMTSPATWFLGVWAFAAVVHLFAQWTAVLATGHRPALGFRAFRIALRENPGVWPFMLRTNLSTSVNQVWMQCGTLLVGATAGPVDAGGFRLAHRLSQAVIKPVELAAKALFPELARLVAQGDRALVQTLLIRVTAVAAAFASVAILISLLAGRDILRLMAGPPFEFAYNFLLLLTVAAAVTVTGFAFEPFLNAHRKAGTVLKSYAVAALLYVAALLALFGHAGASAAALAAIIAAVAIDVQLGIASWSIVMTPTKKKPGRQIALVSHLEWQQ